MSLLLKKKWGECGDDNPSRSGFSLLLDIEKKSIESEQLLTKLSTRQ
jgi:hypothetical protein